MASRSLHPNLDAKINKYNSIMIIDFMAYYALKIIYIFSLISTTFNLFHIILKFNVGE